MLLKGKRKKSSTQTERKLERKNMKMKLENKTNHEKENKDEMNYKKKKKKKKNIGWKTRMKTHQKMRRGYVKLSFCADKRKLGVWRGIWNLQRSAGNLVERIKLKRRSKMVSALLQSYLSRPLCSHNRFMLEINLRKSTPDPERLPNVNEKESDRWGKGLQWIICWARNRWIDAFRLTVIRHFLIWNSKP